MKINLIISDSHYFTMQKINKIFSDNVEITKYDYNDSSLDELLYDFNAVSLFSDNKFIVIENCDEIFSKSFESEDLLNYFERPSQFTNVIFVTSKIDKTNVFYKYIVKKYQVFDSNDKKSNSNSFMVKAYLKENKIYISEKALDYINNATLNNYDLIISEIDKINILGKGNISDDLVYNLVPITPDGNTNRFIDALLTSDDLNALKCVKNMETLNVDLTKMISLLAWNVRVTYLIKISRKNSQMLNEVLSLYKIPDFKYNKYVTMGNIRSSQEFEDILISLSEIDEKIKKSIVSKDNIGYHLINLFCL